MNLKQSPILDGILRENWSDTLAEFKKIGRVGHDEILAGQGHASAADNETVYEAAGWIARAAWCIKFTKITPDIENNLAEALRAAGVEPTVQDPETPAEPEPEASRPEPEPLVCHVDSFIELRECLDSHFMPDDGPPASEETRRRFAEAFERRARTPGEYNLEEFIAGCGISESAAKPIILDVLERLGRAESATEVAPPAVARHNRWILYKLVPDEGRGKKLPISPRTGEPIGATEQYLEDFVTFEEAAAASVKYGMGISLVLLERDGIVGIDIDGGVTGGVIHPEVQNWLKLFSNTYIEFSPSGTGIHILARGRIAKALGARELPNSGGAKVEMYADSRHLTFTGNRSGGSMEVSDCQLQIDKLLAHLGQETRRDDKKDERRMKAQTAREIHGDNLAALRAQAPGGRNERLNQVGYFAGRAFAAGALGDDAKAVKRQIKEAAKVAWGGDVPDSDLNTFEHSWDDGLRHPLALIDPPEFGKQLVVCLGSEITMERVTWLWHPLLPLGEITVFAGLPDVGKGTAAAGIIATITARRHFYGEESFNHGERDGALILSGEESYGTTTIPRIAAAGGDREKVHIVRGVKFNKGQAQSERTLQLKKDVDVIGEYLSKNPKIILVVIDPIDCYFGGAKKNAAEDVTEIYGALKRLAEKYNVAVLLVDHLNKDSEKAAIHRISGAGAAGARPRSAWLFASDRQDKNVRQVACLKGNVLKDDEKKSLKFRFISKDVIIDGTPEPQPVAEWLGRSSVTAAELLAKPDAEAGAGAMARNILKELLAAGPQLQSDIATKTEDMGINPITLRRAKETLGIESIHLPGSRKWYWKLPGEDNQTDLKF
jgi:AAA domain